MCTQTHKKAFGWLFRTEIDVKAILLVVNKNVLKLEPSNNAKGLFQHRIFRLGN